GLAGGDTLTINGTSTDDTFTVNPTDAGSGGLNSGLSPALSFTGATAVTVNGGTGGFDVVNVLGTAGNDTVTSTGTVITLGGTVTIGTGMDRVNVSTLEGNDTITLSLTVAGLQKVVDAGAGDDTVDMSGTTDATILGGDGDDTLTG